MGHKTLDYRLVDVFAERPFEGNGVAVFVDPAELTTRGLQAVTVEVRQFESAFLWPTDDPQTFRTRIFVVDQELAFAGHPALGSAAVLHERHLKQVEGMSHADQALEWKLVMGERTIPLSSQVVGDGIYLAGMDQGRPEFGDPVSLEHRDDVIDALSLRAEDVEPDLPVQWVSTGLRYLTVPVRPGALERARIRSAHFDQLLKRSGAQLAYVLDPTTLEGRNWVNDGSVEDIATGSAAGPAAAYLVKHGAADPSTAIEISQGRFVGRPSTMTVTVQVRDDTVTSVRLSGRVCMAGSGTLDRAPSEV